MQVRRRSKTVGRRAGGFTMIELLIVVTILGTLFAVTGPQISRGMTNSRVNRAARVVMGDLNLAFSLAARQRKPVTISWDNATASMNIDDTITGDPLFSRSLGAGSAYEIPTVSFSPTRVTIMPTGIATNALTITLTHNNGYSRRVEMMRAGLVRLVQ